MVQVAQRTEALGVLAGLLCVACVACAPSAPLSAVAPGEAPPEAVEGAAPPETDGPPPALEVAARAQGGDGDAPPSLRAGTYAMDVPGHTPAVVVVPPDGGGPRPLLVAAHGAGDRGEWHCRIWSEVVRGRGFILCPQGKRIDERVPHADALYYYPHHHALDRELTAALGALEAAVGPRLDRRRALYAGFSQGAIFGALIVTARAAELPRALLIEGGHGHYKEWNRAAAQKLAKAPGARVFFGCGGHWCAQGARETSALLEAAGVGARLGYAEGVGHTMGGAMQDELRRGFAWVTEDDARWAAR
jgi:predicted esterase